MWGELLAVESMNMQSINHTSAVYKHLQVCHVNNSAYCWANGVHDNINSFQCLILRTFCCCMLHIFVLFLSPFDGPEAKSVAVLK